MYFYVILVKSVVFILAGAESRETKSGSAGRKSRSAGCQYLFLLRSFSQVPFCSERFYVILVKYLFALTGFTFSSKPYEP